MATSWDDPARPSPPVRDEGDTNRPVFPALLGAALILVAAVGCTAEPRDQSSAPEKPPASAPAGAVADAAAGLKSLESQVDDLSGKVKDLGVRLESRPKAEPAVDLAPLKSRIDDVAKSTEALAPLAKAVDSLEGRMAALDKTLAE